MIKCAKQKTRVKKNSFCKSNARLGAGSNSGVRGMKHVFACDSKKHKVHAAHIFTRLLGIDERNKTRYTQSYTLNLLISSNIASRAPKLSDKRFDKAFIDDLTDNLAKNLWKICAAYTYYFSAYIHII